MINIAQVGVGYWGPNLLRNLIANKRCDVKIIVDLDEERRDFVKSLYPSVDTTDNIQNIFDNSEIDAVIIATPAATHFSIAMSSLQSGKHIFVEKPMAKTIDEVEQISVLARKNHLIAMVGHTFIYNPAVRYLKNLIDSGELGDIRYIYSQRLNLGRIRSDVDVLWNFAPHDVSIIQYLLGNPTPISVVRHGMDYVQTGIDDVVFMDIVYPNKIMAHIHVSWLDPNKIRCLTVVGSKKMAVYDDIAENQITIYDKGIDRMAILGKNMDYDNHSFRFNHRSGDVILPKIQAEEPLKIEIAHFLDCVQNNVECLTGTDHALEVIRILSGECGKNEKN